MTNIQVSYQTDELDCCRFDRKLVVKMNDAYLLKHLSKDPKLNIPDIDDEDIIIYIPKRGSSKYQDSDYKGRDKEFVGQERMTPSELIHRLLISRL